MKNCDNFVEINHNAIAEEVWENAPLHKKVIVGFFEICSFLIIVSAIFFMPILFFFVILTKNIEKVGLIFCVLLVSFITFIFFYTSHIKTKNFNYRLLGSLIAFIGNILNLYLILCM